MYVISMIKQALLFPVYCITLNAPICTRIHIHTRTTTCNVPLCILKSKWNAIRSGCRAQAGRFHDLIFKCVCFLFGTARWFGDSSGGRLQTIHHRASAHQSGYPPCATPLNIYTYVCTYVHKSQQHLKGAITTTYSTYIHLCIYSYFLMKCCTHTQQHNRYDCPYYKHKYSYTYIHTYIHLL